MEEQNEEYFYENSSEEIYEEKPRELIIIDQVDEEREKDLGEPLSLCKCLLSDEVSETVIIPERKEKVLNIVSKTEEYLRERRIPELIRFFLTKILAQGQDKPIPYLQELLDECMLFRAGYGAAPVLYEDRHLEAVLKSFDPGQRGWLSAGQIRRACVTLGLTPDEIISDKVPVKEVLENFKMKQEKELYELLVGNSESENVEDD